MFNLNPFAISGLLIAIVYLPLFVLIFLKGKTKPAKIYSFHILAVASWGIGAFLIGINNDPQTANLILKIGFTGVIWIPVFFYHASISLFKRPPKLFLIFIYIQAIYFSIANFKGTLSSPEFMFQSFYYYKATLLYIAHFIIWLLIVSLAHLQLIKLYRESYPEEKREIFILFLAIIGFLGGTTNFLPALGWEVYPFGNFLVPIHAIMISYTILKHQLLDIRLVITKSLIYTFLLALISIVYLLTIMFLERLLESTVGYRSIFISIMVAFTLGLAFIPLRNKIQHIIDKLFFKRSHFEIARENELLRKEVAHADRLKTTATLASGIAHEIRNPLTAIKTFTEALPNKLEDKDFLEKFSRIVGSEVNRINRLVTDLLEFARPPRPQYQVVYMNQLITETLDFLNSKFLNHGITFTKELIDDIYSLADSQQIRQVLMNISFNAIDAMPRGGSLKLFLAKNPTAEKFTLSIEDSGMGIPKEDLPHIFDPFFTKKDHGTGLGLSISRSIVVEHGGDIYVKSAVEKGTRIIIELPIKLPLSHTAPEKPERAPD